MFLKDNAVFEHFEISGQKLLVINVYVFYYCVDLEFQMPYAISSISNYIKLLKNIFTSEIYGLHYCF